MKPDALDSGDFSLSLKNPHSSDSGTYTCSMNDDREEIRLADVQLEVRVQQVEVKVEEGVEFAILPCKTTAYLEEDATVEWTRSEPEFMVAYVYQNYSNKVKEQHKFYCERTEMSKEKVKVGDLSLTLKYPTERDTGVYICTIYRKGDIVRQKVILHLLKEIFSSWAKAFLILLIILLVFGGLLFHFRQYLQSVYKLEINSGLESVTLPCKSIVCLPKDVTITWRNNKKHVVHMHQGNSKKIEEQHRRYKDRTQMKESFKLGDFSLILKNPTDKDTDIYTCTISNISEDILIKKQVLLDVRDPYTPQSAECIPPSCPLCWMVLWSASLCSVDLADLAGARLVLGVLGVDAQAYSWRLLRRAWSAGLPGPGLDSLGSGSPLGPWVPRAHERPRAGNPIQNPYCCQQCYPQALSGADSFIIAIDIGSAYTGYAFYVNPQNEGGETQIKRWGKELGLDSPKAPTCILLDEQSRRDNAPRVPREQAEPVPSDAEQQQSPEVKSKDDVRRQFQVQKPVESRIRYDNQSRQGQGSLKPKESMLKLEPVGPGVVLYNDS
ncbi:PREDICTED: uncharacterized protein LOC107084013 [Cyprinodon variegatus]|uniref:uncharacterized protein LOC107084013 n=1 Tax=Cyprinodon variegatus TaxID=28743 RepID=UPI0007426892|nr:PREDICTED: uncharacterized protein LOC107084013 [Cyprinodon variegatus]